MGVNNPRVYLDSCIIIYLIEEHPVYAPIIEARMQNSANVTLCFSALSEMECIVMPLRNQNQTLIARFGDWFRRIEHLALERDIFQTAAKLRAAHHSLKTPDAIHLAVAQYHGCNEFWTNDDRLDAIAPGLVSKIL